MNLKYAPAFILCICILSSCKDDQVDPTCENYAVNLGPFYLKQSTRDLFPYTVNDSFLIFKNETNEELVLRHSFHIQDTTVSSTLDTCPFDSTIQIPYVIRKEEIKSSFVNDSLDISLQLSYEAAFQSDGEEVTGESDIAEVFLIALSQGGIAAFSSLINHKSGQAPLIFTDFFTSITLGSKSFDSVYANKTIPQNEPPFIVYMNYETGIVGIKDNTLNQLWVLDRIE